MMNEVTTSEFKVSAQTWPMEMFPVSLPDPEEGVLYRAKCVAEQESWRGEISAHIVWERWYIVGETEYYWKLAKSPGGTPSTARAKKARKQFAFADPKDALKSLKYRTRHRVWHAERAYLNALAAQEFMETLEVNANV